jgi:hypothetical protein
MDAPGKGDGQTLAAGPWDRYIIRGRRPPEKSCVDLGRALFQMAL